MSNKAAQQRQRERQAYRYRMYRDMGRCPTCGELAPRGQVYCDPCLSFRRAKMRAKRRDLGKSSETPRA